jgi:predicted enzyme related to lactoylglutathione lyase
MSEASKPEVGTVTWIDLTVDNAEKVRDFYTQVVGWTFSPVEMGDYSDFTMETPGEGNAMGGICHARGTNAEIPPHWMLYITVEDVDVSAARCEELGGRIVVGPKEMGAHGRYCIIEDPAGAVAALFAPAPD